MFLVKSCLKPIFSEVTLFVTTFIKLIIQPDTNHDHEAMQLVSVDFHRAVRYRSMQIELISLQGFTGVNSSDYFGKVNRNNFHYLMA